MKTNAFVRQTREEQPSNLPHYSIALGRASSTGSATERTAVTEDINVDEIANDPDSLKWRQRVTQYKAAFETSMSYVRLSTQYLGQAINLCLENTAAINLVRLIRRILFCEVERLFLRIGLLVKVFEFFRNSIAKFQSSFWFCINRSLCCCCCFDWLKNVGHENLSPILHSFNTTYVSHLCEVCGTSRIIFRDITRNFKFLFQERLDLAARGSYR